MHKLRMTRRLSQEKLAEKADLSRRHVQRIEAGDRNPSAEMLIKLRRALECTWDELFAGIS